jgi:hypothetical protein
VKGEPGLGMGVGRVVVWGGFVSGSMLHLLLLLLVRVGDAACTCRMQLGNLAHQTHGPQPCVCWTPLQL